MKIKLLLKRFLLGLILAKGFIFMYPIISHSQSRTFTCQNSSVLSSTIADSRLTRPIVVWRPTAESTCNDVANRFEAASEEGNLRFILKRGNDVCGMSTENAGCTRLLFTINERVDPNSLLLRIFAGRETIGSGSYIFQNSTGTIIDWEGYLNSLRVN